jgi:TonB family protein
MALARTTQRQSANPQQKDQPVLTAEPELLNTNVSLWRELTDDVFERHFRQRHFGNESISRQQAIDRLVAMGAKCSPQAPVHPAATPEVPGLGAVLTGSAGPANAVSLADIKILVFPRRELPWRSMLLSILAHGLVLSSLLSVRLPQRRTRIIDFETATITYYKMSESLPNVAPKPQNELPHPLESKPRPADFQTDPEVRIRPMNSERSEMVIEQPNVRPVLALPKLLLPNILLQASKMDPGREPLVVSPDVLRQLAMDVHQPQALGSLPQNSTQALATRQPVLPLPQIAAPAAPATEALPVNQIGERLTGLQQRAAPLPYAAPPVEDVPVSFQIEAMATQGPDMLVFSSNPAVPKAEIAVPKASTKGRLTGSSIQAAQPLPQGVEELTRAEVVMPSISINSRTAPALAAGTAAVQAPLPRPTELPKPIGPTRPSSLLDFLPSRIPSSKPLAAIRSDIGSAESPLRDYEGRGGAVYTVAINAPNFTSKRGSWIFRFAELSPAEPASSMTNPAAVPLTAPSAIVKVDPKYAPEVVREKLEGVVILFAILRKDGTVDGESVRVIRKVDSRLDLSAREALLNWKFKPSERNGIAVDIQMEVSIPFYFRKEGL